MDISTKIPGDRLLLGLLSAFRTLVMELSKNGALDPNEFVYVLQQTADAHRETGVPQSSRRCNPGDQFADCHVCTGNSFRHPLSFDPTREPVPVPTDDLPKTTIPVAEPTRVLLTQC